MTPWQQRLLGTALALVALITVFAFIGVVFWGLRLILGTLAPVVWSLAIGGILALLLKPLVALFEHYLRLPRTWAILLLYILIIGALGALAYLVLPLLVEQAVAFLGFLPTLFEKFTLFLSERFPSLALQIEASRENSIVAQLNAQALQGIKNVMLAGLPMLERAREGLVHFFAWVSAFVVIPIYLFFFLQTNRDFLDDMRRELAFVPASGREDFLYLVQEFVNILLSFFRGQIIIGLSIGVLFAIGFTLVGLKFGMLLGLTIGCLNIIPYFGTMFGLATAIPIAFMQPEGGTVLAGMALGVFAVVHLIDSYFLTPRIMG
ncbi:MAG TPA: AI-2E family transporter, partial [Opitutales bacterium]|nr:AI-2E family transporter [Opitutales bacterium]